MFMLQSYDKFIEKHLLLNKNIRIWLEIVSYNNISVSFLLKL